MLRAEPILSRTGCCSSCCCSLGLLQLKALNCSSCVLCFHYLQILHAPLHLRVCSCHTHTLEDQGRALHSHTYSAPQCEHKGMSLLSRDGRLNS